ncbi:MAG: hypothetical protein EOO06_12545 [Chitinophagaceae bacterium]|nr:MAG: hypothetical protein EOO06_12545 [Chitinophagaceae bacterium]
MTVDKWANIAMTMVYLKKIFAILVLFNAAKVFAQDNLEIQINKGKDQPVAVASIELRRITDSSLVRSALTDQGGIARLQQIPAGDYFLKISHSAYQTLMSEKFQFPKEGFRRTYQLHASMETLQGITVQGKKAFIQQQHGKVIINVDAAVSNAGTTVLELLEKSPGVLVDRNGSVSLQNKSGVLIMIDDKPTYLSGTDLSNMLSSMSSSQVDQIELITNPSAKYDAAGNAGIINIRTKKSRQKGFNGNFTISAGHGRYYKNNNSLVMNYRNGRYNFFLNYTNNNNKSYTEMYALRTYFKQSGADSSSLIQPTLFKSQSMNHSVKTGLDYYLTEKTTLGFTLAGSLTDRDGTSSASATWLNEAKTIDSAIITSSATNYHLKNGNVGVYGRHRLNGKNDLSFDADWLNYKISNDQLFTNEGSIPQYYYEGSMGNLPSTLEILSAKADHVARLPKQLQVESGIKISNTKTDNLADYSFSFGDPWQQDPKRSNHFLYDETIKAVYSSVQQKLKGWSYQAGIRYEKTAYIATQLGNSLRSDSAFRNDYEALFPSGFVSVELDSNNSVSVTMSRRLDRPPFQKLNPFTFTINKYTFEKGNPFTRPQYSWNLELSHLFRQKITTTFSYSVIKDYYSQIFQRDSNNILIYSTGNVGKAYNIGASVSAQVNVNEAWFFTAQTMYSYKKLEGYVWNDYSSDVHQFNFSMNNQFKFGKIYTTELSGFYTGRARNDLQEVLYPNSQVVIGIARPVMKKKGTLKFSIRDIFHTNGMEGLTDFENSEEYFWLRRDSRVAMLSFTYRFGKPFKVIKRNNGSAADEIQRVGA